MSTDRFETSIPCHLIVALLCAMRQTACFISGYQVDGLIVVTKLDSVGRMERHRCYAVLAFCA